MSGTANDANLTPNPNVRKPCSRCIGFGSIAYFGDANVTCPNCNGLGVLK